MGHQPRQVTATHESIGAKGLRAPTKQQEGASWAGLLASERRVRASGFTGREIGSGTFQPQPHAQNGDPRYQVLEFPSLAVPSQGTTRDLLTPDGDARGPEPRSPCTPGAGFGAGFGAGEQATLPRRRGRHRRGCQGGGGGAGTRPDGHGRSGTAWCAAKGTPQVSAQGAPGSRREGTRARDGGDRHGQRREPLGTLTIEIHIKKGKPGQETPPCT